ncbi:Acyl-CoA dehydrogenase domain protein [Sphingobium herbicidovorans NBRC 16415]|uniref:Acyl-CoA dehydrogenase domain protein n=1 Tax=Sphingobium herbicidovorans (strain ATCC 700291 / DSM 11019 / CCUG 56400 / KCTC 2939 / LMG 18315 / NBRC 16415 / MH) TaxID=1219045 RepID=A0A086PC00_SPHHM|nr:acyl-CoA dehydrogenase family protein [Sphingobium herbicidovorans]KFG90918.1 Acyl-CoA dehydrogenase domain protein [Sphingobium herbicidovorans NBRC 16415]
MDLRLTPEQEDLKKRAYAAGLEFREAAFKWDEEDAVDYRAVSDRFGELGFFGLTAPKEWGGQGGDCMSYLLAVSEAIRASGSWIVGEPMFCTTGPGPSMIMLSESQALKDQYLRDVLTGKLGCAIALTEPAHGSDLTYLETTAVRDGDSWVVNGSKSYVTGAIYNELYATFVRFDGIPGPRGIGAVLIPADSPGFTMSRGPVFLGTRSIPHGDIELKDCRIPLENLIIGPGHFARLMTAFNMERLHNCAVSLGGMLCAYDEASEHVQQREQFGRPVIEFQHVYHTLADVAVTIEAHRLLSYKAAANAIDGKYPELQDVSIAKLFGGTRIPEVAMKCAELMGGKGVTSVTRTQRIVRDAVTNVVAGGAPAVLRNSIAAALFPGRKFPQTRG